MLNISLPVIEDKLSSRFRLRFRICFVFLCCIENVLLGCDWFGKFILWDN
jgi:hypothetical protein